MFVKTVGTADSDPISYLSEHVSRNSKRFIVRFATNTRRSGDIIR
jgi:hypothetical protein